MFDGIHQIFCDPVYLDPWLSQFFRGVDQAMIEEHPIQRVVNTIEKHLLGILNAIVLKATNAGAESVNSKVQALKRRASGYRNRDRFRDAIFFHCAGLDLYPTSLTHTNP